MMRCVQLKNLSMLHQKIVNCSKNKGCRFTEGNQKGLSKVRVSTHERVIFFLNWTETTCYINLAKSIVTVTWDRKIRALNIMGYYSYYFTINHKPQLSNRLKFVYTSAIDNQRTRRRGSRRFQRDIETGQHLMTMVEQHQQYRLETRAIPEAFVPVENMSNQRFSKLIK